MSAHYRWDEISILIFNKSSVVIAVIISGLSAEGSWAAALSTSMSCVGLSTLPDERFFPCSKKSIPRSTKMRRSFSPSCVVKVSLLDRLVNNAWQNYLFTVTYGSRMYCPSGVRSYNAGIGLPLSSLYGLSNESLSCFQGGSSIPVLFVFVDT